MNRYLMAYFGYVIVAFIVIMSVFYSMQFVTKIEQALSILIVFALFHFKINIPVCKYFEKKFENA